MAGQLNRRRQRRWLTALGIASLFLVQELAPISNSAPQTLAQGAGPAWDVVVYGSTPAGITAAIAAARENAKVVLLEPTHHVGGMTANGLGASDVGIKDTIGGLALDFFRRLGVTDDYGPTPSWNVTPGIAERTLGAMLADAHVPVVLDARLREHGAVVRSGGRISQIAMLDGRR